MWPNRLITWIDTQTGFDRWGPNANPLIRRMLRREKRLSLRAILWLTFGWGLVGLIVGTVDTLTATTDEIGSGGLIVTFGWLFELVTPFVVAISSAVLTRRLVRSDYFDMIRITPISNRTLVTSLVFTSLYRLRYVLMALIGLMPLIIVETFHWFLVIDLTISSLIYYGTVPTPPTWGEVVWPTLFGIVIILSLWSMTILAAALGVQAAVSRRYASAAVIVAPGSVLMLMVCPAVVCAMSSPALPAENGPVADCIIIGVLMAMVFGPLFMTINAIYTTAIDWRR